METSNQEHSYLNLDHYLKQKFGEKTLKVALNGSFSCPNRDGKTSNLGCLFCSEKGSGDFAGDPSDSLADQFIKVKTVMLQKWPKAKFIAYFQANTNTYGSLIKIKALFSEAIALDPNIVGLSLATRCDCLSLEIMDYLEELNKRIPLWIELGLQSSNQESMKAMNLGYTTKQFADAVRSLEKRNLPVIAHIINGLPNETFQMMLNTISFINSLPIHGIKIHSLCIIKNTPLEKMYSQNPFSILSLMEYVDIVTEQLARLNPKIVIHRISGDAPKNLLVTPKWANNKKVILNEINKAMKHKQYFQGCLYKSI
jgi:hypothetical protein